jgi:membrane protease YdiL (CAAX protease family)
MQPKIWKLGSFFGFALMALTIIGLAGVFWGALIYANLNFVPRVPWCLPGLCLFLIFVWRYLGGSGWPRRTSQRRRILMRARSVSRSAFAWSVVAGLLAIGSLSGFWILMFRLVPMHPNLILPARFSSSPVFTTAIILGASLLAPIVEEISVRGYLQSVLERDFSPVVAVVLSSLVFAAAHVSQGLAWPKLLFYFLVGATFGSIAFLNDSILPVIPVHVAGDLLFFLFVWPYDESRISIAQHGPDLWFWVHVVQTIAFAAAAILAFIKLRSISTGELSPSIRGNSQFQPAQASGIGDYIHHCDFSFSDLAPDRNPQPPTGGYDEAH